jgi:hypothetical protein
MTTQQETSPMPTGATREANRSYRQVLRNRQVAGLLLGDLLANGRRLLATSVAGETGRYAVNGLLGLNTTFALYIVGPVLGGVIVASTSAGVALFFDACGALILLVAVLVSVPRAANDRDALRRPRARESGWRILRRRPVAARLLVVVFFFNFFYMPIEVALPPVRPRDAGRRRVWSGPHVGCARDWRIRRRRSREPVAEPSTASCADRDHRPVGDVPDRSCARWRSPSRADRLWSGRPGVGAVHACCVQLPAIGAQARRATAGRHALDDWLYGGRTTWPDRWRTTHRAGRKHRRACVVRWADTAAAPDCGTGCSQARIRVGHTHFTRNSQAKSGGRVGHGSMLSASSARQQLLWN